MKAMIVVDIPENKNITNPLTPFNTKVILDYGNEVLELHGEVHSAASEHKDNSSVILDTQTNRMICNNCGAIVGSANDLVPRYCQVCGKELSGGYIRRKLC